MRGGEGRGEGRWEKWEVEHGLWAKGLRWGMVCRIRGLESWGGGQAKASECHWSLWVEAVG